MSNFTPILAGPFNVNQFFSERADIAAFPTANSLWDRRAAQQPGGFRSSRRGVWFGRSSRRGRSLGVAGSFSCRVLGDDFKQRRDALIERRRQ
jgi:hypothetical protein